MPRDAKPQGAQEQTSKTRPGRLSLPVGRPLRDGLIISFDDILSHARRWALDAPDDPVTAVHEYRKSIRRARSMLCMLRSLMTRRDYNELATTLRDLHRATSAQRDRDVLIDTVNKLGLAAVVPRLMARLQPPRSGRDDESDGDLATESAAQRSIDLLQDGARRLEPLSGAFGAALPAEVSWKDLTDGIQKTYRRARRDMNATLHSTDDERLHDWRKRNKELVYQVELLAGNAGYREGDRVRKRLARLSERLGEIVDIIVLAEAADRLADDTEGLYTAKTTARAKKKRIRRALERGAILMNDKPKSFARRLVRGVREARRRRAGE